MQGQALIRLSRHTLAGFLEAPGSRYPLPEHKSCQQSSLDNTTCCCCCCCWQGEATGRPPCGARARTIVRGAPSAFNILLVDGSSDVVAATAVAPVFVRRSSFFPSLPSHHALSFYPDCQAATVGEPRARALTSNPLDLPEVGRRAWRRHRRRWHGAVDEHLPLQVLEPAHGQLAGVERADAVELRVPIAAAERERRVLEEVLILGQRPAAVAAAAAG
eukprot:33912-Chlamydomonas_euryale.AAC.1